MPFIEHHRLQLGEELGGGLVGEQQREGFGGGDQDVGRVAQLRAPFAGAGVAVAQADAQGPAHGLDRLLDRRRQIAAEGPQGGEHQQAQARLGATGFGQQAGDRAEHGGVGLAGAGGHLDQAALAGEIGAPGLALEGQRPPPLVAKPGLDGIQDGQGVGFPRIEESK